jgi:hypothetical protein
MWGGAIVINDHILDFMFPRVDDVPRNKLRWSSGYWQAIIYPPYWDQMKLLYQLNQFRSDEIIRLIEPVQVRWNFWISWTSWHQIKSLNKFNQFTLDEIIELVQPIHIWWNCWINSDQMKLLNQFTSEYSWGLIWRLVVRFCHLLMIERLYFWLF